MRVVVVGSVNRDVVARVERIPGPGETVLASSLQRTPGGKGGNQAVAAARAGGAPVAFVGAVGDDPDGEYLRAALAGAGVDVSGLETTTTAPTGTALISVDDAGENAIVVVAGANAASDALTARQRELVASARVLVTQLEVPVALVREAAAARPDGAWHVLNAAPSAPFTGAAEALFASLDVLIVNEHEARDITGAADSDAALDDLARRVPAVVLTLGASGCLVAHGAARVRVPAFPARPVDTTGAGDTFCGVVAATLAASGKTPSSLDVALLAAAARAGAAAAALAVGRPGAQAAVPSAGEVEALLATGGAS